MKETINEALKSLIMWAQNVGDFLGAELPIFAKEIVTYGIYSNFILAGILFIFIIICIIVYKLLWKNIDEDVRIGFGIILGIILIVCIPMSISSIIEGVKASVAPRLYLIEQIKNLLK